MIQITTKDKEKVLEAIRQGKIDAADLSYPNLIDAIILKMKQEGLLELLDVAFSDKRADNLNIPLYLILTLAITAKMKIRTSLTDMPYAITDAGTLSEIGWNIWDNERNLEEGLMSEGAIRNLIIKYSADDLIGAYNEYVQKHIFPKQGIEPAIHILDCTELEVKLENSNYENSEVITDNDGTRRGYKLATIRGLYDDTGVIEEIKLGSIKQHDLELSREMVMNCKVLKDRDIIINDRGFISRELMNYLKIERGVDTYIPLKRNMEAYQQAVSIAKEQNNWTEHPNRKRKGQKISYVESLGCHWRSNEPEKDVAISACVVNEPKNNEYFVFVTTDITKTARQIISTYELRPEIEEDYRQIKDFWQIEDFKSTKYNFIAFHIVMVLCGYLFFQIYKGMKDGQQYVKKTLPVAVKKYVTDTPKTVIIYTGQYFAIFGFLEFIQLYALCDTDVKACLDPILAKV